MRVPTNHAARGQRRAHAAMLGAMIAMTKLMAAGGDEAFAPWQGMQYRRDMFSGRAKLRDPAMDRYPDLIWTSVRELPHSRKW